MKKHILIAAGIMCSALLNAQVRMPQPSPTTTIVQDFGTGQIELVYSRPSIKGRTLFAENSDLAPVGKTWRTGANDATRIHFSDPVTAGGTSLDSGTYLITTVPGKPSWKITFAKATQTADGFAASDKVTDITIPSMINAAAVETFTMQFANIKPETCDLQLLWGKTVVSIPVSTNVKEIVRKQLETAMQQPEKPYWDAARFYYEFDKDYPKALENVNSAISTTPNGFWMYLMKAKIQKEMGDKTGAKASAEKCIEVATKAKNDDYVKQSNALIKSL